MARADSGGVTFSDPFGLCPIEKDGIPCRAIYAEGVTVSSPELRGALDNIAATADVADLFVYGGDRDIGTNSDVGGARRSQHLIGQAADVIFVGVGKRRTADILFHNTARKEAGVRLLYHGPGAALPEHSHLDLAPGPDLLEQPKGSDPRYVVLPDPIEHEENQ